MALDDETLTYFVPVNVSFRVVGKDKKGWIPLRKDYFFDLQLLDEAEYIKRRQVTRAQFNEVNLEQVIHVTMYQDVLPKKVLTQGYSLDKDGVSVICRMDGKQGCGVVYFSISEALSREEGIGIALTKDKDCFNLCYNSVL